MSERIYVIIVNYESANSSLDLRIRNNFPSIKDRNLYFISSNLLSAKDIYELIEDNSDTFRIFIGHFSDYYGHLNSETWDWIKNRDGRVYVENQSDK